MTTDEIQRCLRASPILCALSEEAIRQFATRVRIAHWTRNQVILRKGDPGDTMMIVVAGRVKIVSVSESGRERILNIIEPGESFGEMAILDGEPRCADAVATEATTAAVLRRKDLDECLAANPAFAQQIIGVLCRRLRKATTLVEDTLFLDPSMRLARRLRALVHEMGRLREDTGDWVLEGLSQQELADAIGLTRESVNKLLSGWRAEEIVSLDRRTVVVRDLARINRLARLDG